VPNDRLTQLRRRIAKAPLEPGVYRFLDADGTVLYVGKAKELRNRLKSYVQKNPDKQLGPWKLALIERIADVEMTVVGSELEALVLETNLIKQIRPKYNVLMKDDKNYVYVRVSLQETYPRVDIVRKMEEDGAKYFGPKTSAEQVRRTLNFLRKIFPYRTCKMSIEPAGSMEMENGKLRMDNDGGGFSKNDSAIPNSPFSIFHSSRSSTAVSIPIEVVCTNRDRPTPCLDFHIGQCTAPCIGNITPEQYRADCIEGVLQFFKGDHGAVERLLKDRMAQAAAAKEFEQAAKLRDQLKTLEHPPGIQPPPGGEP
jgi:excinuclease ABC subunit C